MTERKTQEQEKPHPLQTSAGWDPGLEFEPHRPLREQKRHHDGIDCI